ncbi:hypothetical protein HETIRDRAFT_332279 [Heterobasidion irregulare TC 32-1]|uniref:FAD-binding domain-containing protein n=1 Tax=Heterobasidion irregulare (strain TC 32-1) TaxID=747525 RepID=W4JN62_HETIT|nr:uncharacterized protein HETIRDRAFT_332279 [Heterobasidion irregulare TC 32-1]ETW74978.1 hypothetical protein HETIRDRAFT_332279 [Heterobasidion irregulare TC 32-1]
MSSSVAAPTLPANSPEIEAPARTQTPGSVPRQQQHVLVVGSGLVGLTIAQGLKRRGIPCTVFERDAGQHGRLQGWSITIHWGLSALEQVLPRELFDELISVAAATDAWADAAPAHLDRSTGNFLVIDGRDLTVEHRLPPSKRRIRADRAKVRNVLLAGLDIQYDKRLSHFERVPAGGVRAFFEDGTSEEGTVLVGADGNNSTVRRGLVAGEKARSKPIPVVAYGVVQRYTAEQIAPLRALDAHLFNCINPDTVRSTFFLPDHHSHTRFRRLPQVSALSKDVTHVAPQRIADMKARAEGFAEPLYSLINNIDDTVECTRVSPADWMPIPWDNLSGRVTLAGDATGPMTMYRGDGVNHGIVDAASFVSQLKRFVDGKVGLQAAIGEYEDEVRARREVAIPLSRRAALDAHGMPSRMCRARSSDELSG